MTPQQMAGRVQRISDVSLVVQGRFHAFSLAKGLASRGLRVNLLTNYPASKVKLWTGADLKIRSFLAHGLLHHGLQRVGLGAKSQRLERLLHESFSRWSARQLAKDKTSLIHCFSGVAREIIEQRRGWEIQPKVVLARGSSHIVEQRKILQQEELRAGVHVEKPSDWMVQRELWEYAFSDHVLVLSEFARHSFLRQGFDSRRLSMLPLGCDVSRFRATPAMAQERCNRLMQGRRLNVLGTGSFCLRKGALDFVSVARAMASRMDFCWVGDIAKDAHHLAQEAAGLVRFVPRVSEFQLPLAYQEADLYFFPTLEDGFAVTLVQAMAGAVPILASTHSAAPELLRMGGGWVFEPRDVSQMLRLLHAADADRQATVACVEALCDQVLWRDWSEVTDDFIRLYDQLV